MGGSRDKGWRKSSYSGTTSGSDCVELARIGGAVGIRDSKDPHGPKSVVSREALKAALAEHR
ncbi:hypothetical protein Acsp03_52370 [Actinomadura sp. NBRC 104412]|uniref:DUF397 domain-containing protein n=1 Tax=Actinomadura sp. NBRC 104412 TaxID=3032203 RepID=UPI0024A1ED0A|nr:DUF397 domain-containing protein [Actinomadura sp. NBRC 104412]GLZ07771.1 hypothetical protein Acsp03_52370 [Actinomadura sp. NBRC 104412]